MNKKEAEQVLKCWINCPHSFGVGQCRKTEEEYCECGCWSQQQVKEAVSLLLKN